MIRADPEACVHIVDDEEAIRDSLAWLLASAGIAARSWPSGEAFLDGLPLVGTACVILDVRMEGMPGPDVFERMIAAGCDAPVIFLTGHAEVPVAVEMLKAGAFDFVEKPFNDNRLVDIVGRAMSHHDGIRKSASDRARLEARLAELSPREREVLAHVVRGRLNKQIAGDLNLAMRTVEVHRARLLSKLGVKNAVELSGLLARFSEET
jgi:two-component system response regulator DctR